jgi:predicted transcriptional regulator
VSKTNLPRPTDAELVILRALWKPCPSTVRRAQDELNQYQPIMTEKGLVSRDESERTHVYEAALPEEETQKQLVSDLMD